MSETSILETIHRMIVESERRGSKLTELTISDAAARELADELHVMQLTMTRGKIYQELKSGRSKYMDRTITVAPE